MLGALSGRERDVLLAHERAHAASSHYLFTSAARLAAAATRSSARSPPRSATPSNAGRTSARRLRRVTAPLTARAIARAALASSASPPGRPRMLSALGITGPAWAGRTAAGLTGARLRRPGPVPRRVAAMLAPPRGASPLLLLLATALVAVSAGCALAGAVSVHQLVELAQLPPR